MLEDKAVIVFSYENKFSPQNSEKPTLLFRFISVEIAIDGINEQINEQINIYIIIKLVFEMSKSVKKKFNILLLNHQFHKHLDEMN